MSLPEFDFDAAAVDLATAVACLQRIARSRRFTPDVARAVHAMPHAAWLREFCTVHIGTARHVGKSTFLIDHVPPDGLLVLARRSLVPSDVLRRAAEPGRGLTTTRGTPIVLAADFERFSQRTRFAGVSTIYVDEPQVVFGHNNGLHHDWFWGLLGALKFEGQIVFVGQS